MLRSSDCAELSTLYEKTKMSPAMSSEVWEQNPWKNWLKGNFVHENHLFMENPQ